MELNLDSKKALIDLLPEITPKQLMLSLCEIVAL